MADEQRAGKFSHEGVEYLYATYPSDITLPDGLTDAEADVAKMIAAGRSNAEIAEARSVSVRTIANQVASIFRKVGVSSRSDLLVMLRGSPK